MTILQVPGDLSAFGLAKEAVPGTPVPATQFEPFTTCTIMPESGLFYPHTMMGIRDTEVFPLFGQEKLAGPIEGPLFPVNGILLFIASIGTDSAQSGSAPGIIKQGTLASAAAGATTLTYTVTGGTAAPVLGDVFMVGTATAPALATYGLSAIPYTGGATVAGTFLIKPSAVSGAGPYTFTVPATGPGSVPRAVSSSSITQAVIAPFYHNINPANTLTSLTIEKNLGNFQSEQYAGSMVDSFNLKLPTTNAEASFSAAIQALGPVAIMDSPTAISVDPGVPFVFAEGSVSFLGGVLTNATNVELEVQNTVKDSYTVGASHLPTYLTATSRKFTAKATVIFSSLDDAVVGYFKKTFPSTATSGLPAQGAFSLTLTHPAGAGIIGVNFPQVNIDKVGDDIKIGDVIMQSLDLTPSYSLSAGYGIQAYVANASYAAY